MQENEIDVIDIQGKGWLGKIKNWGYENWQTVLIVLIVLIIGVSAYNYNQRGRDIENDFGLVAITDNELENSDEENDDNKDDKNTTEINISDSSEELKIENIDKEKAANEDNGIAPTNNAKLNDTDNKEKKSPSSSNNNSENIYAITARYGEGITHLARHALEKHLAKTGNGSELTKEHKIYIEDYLQNKTGKQKIEIGHQEIFSEDLIQEAISNANRLSEKSLENLSKYTKNIK